MSSERVEPTGRPGRYQRSAAGLITSLVVTVLVIGGVLFFLSAFRNDLEVEPESIDYLEPVGAAQQAGLSPVYPAALPEGWIATGTDIEVQDGRAFMLRMLTDDERFVAVRREDASVTALLTRWVDEEVEVAGGYTVPDAVRRPVARTWKGYTDADGDTAYAAELGEDTVLVFGSASAEELQDIVDSLVTTPID